MLVCNGGKNECSQIDYAIKSGLFPNAICVQCIWNIVDCGWQYHKPSPQLEAVDSTISNYDQNQISSLLKKE